MKSRARPIDPREVTWKWNGREFVRCEGHHVSRRLTPFELGEVLYHGARNEDEQEELDNAEGDRK